MGATQSRTVLYRSASADGVMNLFMLPKCKKIQRH